MQSVIDRDTKYLEKCRRNSPFVRLTYEEFYALPIIELKDFTLNRNLSHSSIRINLKMNFLINIRL